MSRKIKIPNAAFETFTNIARKDDGDTHELLCFFLFENADSFTAKYLLTVYTLVNIIIENNDGTLRVRKFI